MKNFKDQLRTENKPRFHLHQQLTRSTISSSEILRTNKIAYLAELRLLNHDYLKVFHLNPKQLKG